MKIADSSSADTPSPDLDRLAGELIAMAKQRLADPGQFYPFALAVRADGTMVQLNYNPPGQAPLVARFIEALKEKIREGARFAEFRAAGLCFMAKAACPPDKRVSDAVCLQLHDATGQSINYFLPYARAMGGLTYEEAFRTDGAMSLFPEPQA